MKEVSWGPTDMPLRDFLLPMRKRYDHCTDLFSFELLHGLLGVTLIT
jgi:hypothetical protein